MTNNSDTILIVDDIRANVRLLAGLLDAQGYNIQFAFNGNMALNAVQKELPDLILLDIKLPDINGFEVCQRLKKDPYSADVPIIFVSASDKTLDKVTAFSVGGVDYITKPFQSHEILARVETHLTIKQLHTRLLRQKQELEQRIFFQEQMREERDYFIDQLRITADISTELVSILDVTYLLEKLIALVQRRFKLYHVHIYLLNKAKDDLIMQVGTGDIGRKLNKRQHHIVFNHPHSLVAKAARNRDIIVVGNVTQEPDFLPNSFLPNTLSEVAIPLISNNELIGVLDMQDNHPHRFTHFDIDAFRIMASQIAVALQNARLFAERK
ncbi:response regulator [Anaerolineales bacterium HSG24]|nr:response regulator [Anaerolineales bacterium HSG24]